VASTSATTSTSFDRRVAPWGSATWWRWVSRTTLGEAAGFLFPVLVVLSGADDLPAGPRLAVLLLAGAAEGAILGWAQS
jgi:Ca2+-transporting ATPase